jgi:hypothetical protein
MARPKRVLLASYGGGHVASLLSLAQRLQSDPRIELHCLGFTTARSAFEAAGLAAMGAADLLQPGDECWLERARPLLEQPQHPAVAPADALAYYALGLKDLAAELGLEEAVLRVQNQGRRCFEPLASCARFLEWQRPDLVITSTCPRSELALQRAAHHLGIASLAIGDLFLQDEEPYICGADYASHLSVIAAPVRDRLLAQGCRSQIHIGGNPAFDALLDPQHRIAAQRWRHQLGLTPDQRVLLWACHPAVETYTGRQFVDPATMLTALEQYSSTRPDVRLLIRQHPSAPLFPPGQSVRGGWICPPELPIEICLHAVDQVLVEVSTVGLQAALLGRSLVTYRACGEPPYAELGLAVDVAELADLPAALDICQRPNLEALGYPLDQPAAKRLVLICQRILGLAT